LGDHLKFFCISGDFFCSCINIKFLTCSIESFFLYIFKRVNFILSENHYTLILVHLNFKAITAHPWQLSGFPLSLTGYPHIYGRNNVRLVKQFITFALLPNKLACCGQ